MKDNFSNFSEDYLRFRPGYPPALFSFLFKQCQHFDLAWDCATGNGQIAIKLAERFQFIEATDISENQLKNALSHPKIHYSQQAAESPLFSQKSFDLIVVGQAAHWLELDRFYSEVQRVLKPGGILALVGYNPLSVDDGPIDALIKDLYFNVLGTYWDAERRHVDSSYSTLPFPFEEIEFSKMEMQYSWKRDHLVGYLSTWSAVQHFTKQNGYSAVDGAFFEALKTEWPDEAVKLVKFPIFGRMGRGLNSKAHPRP